ncbi:hypothetical protein PHYSODRAFT_298099 [Phytophthora sojae]|uniref:Uncharacterized protein n=1 Tax=Phytophthora sojae (strain P6497) TaxID=1094619 RepID=G4Z7D3_PHYSP|nr:hypothetical protein PHYSODRAFT_298099 [Phytophthora sojae]EGZ19641.1 hypothetical protein PHYSODRAFT_298099 [Phytophthora sojae]|eukprot:XP_009522358.1 hypothetical protein PHYSODRAFT_298099 [Phytophthora sojae]
MEATSPAKPDNLATLETKVADLIKRVENLECYWRMHTQQQITRLKELKKNKLEWNSHMPPSRTPVDEHLRHVSEAFYSIVKVAHGGEGCYNTGFCISEDGFLLTMNDSCRSFQGENTDHRHSEVTFFDGTRLDCTHVQIFQCSGVSLSLLKGDFPVPPLRPDDLFITNESMALAPFGVDDIGFPTPAITVGRVRTPLDTKEKFARLELGTPSDTKAGELETRMTGGPVLSMRPGYFAGVITSMEQSEAVRFCPVTLTSLVWLAIQRAMKQYRETYMVQEPTTKQHGDLHCCVLL